MSQDKYKSTYECNICDNMLQKIKLLGQKYDHNIEFYNYFMYKKYYLCCQNLTVEYVNSQISRAKYEIDRYHNINKGFLEHYKHNH